ncbi:homoserine kinase [alpha proteobacterium U9-1i]|nr:homoserine kinase [alpha proteobacterium U9-1i]
MAVYTHLSDTELNALLADYDLGEATGFHGIAEGVENTNFALTTTKGRFILTLFEKRVAEADLPFFVGVMARLAERGFPAPQPAPTKAGARITRVKEKPAAIVSFLDGVWPRAPNARHCAVIGEALARMHNALSGFETERRNALGPQGWAPLIEPNLRLADELRPGLAADISADLAHTVSSWPRDLPRGVIHADLFPDNAMFVGERLSGVIDFYFACTDFLAYDLAVCLNAWCFERERDFNFTKGQAMIAAYEKVRPLTNAERDALPLLARGAALRFFATRLADWSATPEGALVKPKDPLEYANKLAFHRTARNVADYGG